jgi:SAM-dependent methyltransferase
MKFRDITRRWRRAAPYDPLASLYDRHWGYEFAQAAKASLGSYLLPHLPRGGTVLDLCCGTGLILAHLDQCGFRAHGVDESAKMLAMARRNAPEARLQQADMAEFRLRRRFDAAVSFYNSLNHARSAEHLCAVMCNVANHLADNGLFLFDYVSPDAFESGWEWCEQVHERDNIWTLDYTFDKSSGQATCLVNQTGRIRQTCFAPHQIREALNASRLVIVSETPMQGTAPAGGRHLVLARKQ